MAKIVTSGIGTVEIRNKLGGTVFMTGIGGASIRNLVTPTNRRSPAQQAQRIELASLSSNWRALTAAQRLAWISMSSNYSFTDIFGHPLKPTGNALYVSLNRNLMLTGQPPIDTPIAPENVAQSTSFVITTNTTIAQVLTLDAAVDANSTVLVFATPPVSAGKNFFKSKYAIIGSFPAAHVAALDTFALYQAKYGDPIVDMKISFSLKFINNTTGQAGVPLNLDSITA